jgi:hypothetical protein
VGARILACGRCADAPGRKFDGVGVPTPNDVILQHGLGSVVRYIEARLRRMDENVFMLVFEALLHAWPYKR